MSSLTGISYMKIWSHLVLYYVSQASASSGLTLLVVHGGSTVSWCSGGTGNPSVQRAVQSGLQTFGCRGRRQCHAHLLSSP